MTALPAYLVALATLCWPFCSRAAETACPGPFLNHGGYIGCEASAAEKIHLKMEQALAQAMRCAKDFHNQGDRDFTSDVKDAQADWERFTMDECGLEGSIGGGASAPEPGSDACMQRLNSRRIEELESLCRTFAGK